ncbi:hypothetical protein KAR48_02165 [bacterium]|nr:hypothetical protein [bacterium]
MLNLELHAWLSVIPPLVAIIIAIIYRQVYVALIVGLWTGTTILAGGNPLKGLADTIDLCIRVFQDPGNTRVILFSATIGAVIAFTQHSGGVQGFIDWLSARSLIQSRRRAQFLAVFIGIAVPIESSISVLVTGTVSRPLFDRLKISREKLAYLCDSTSAPICAMIPVNAWGAYMAGLLAMQGIPFSFSIYFKSLIYNFYPIAILMMFAFAIGQLCRDMGTGTYVASIAQRLISPKLLPMILFITTGFIAFSTGTSWGTWGIMVPIGIPVVQQMGGDLLPVVAAIVSGGVFGDHCSPISDTTLISSMASASDHMDHVVTQLPYALFAGIVAALGFLIVGLTG